MPHSQSFHYLNPLKISSNYIKEQWEEDTDAVTDVGVEDMDVEDVADVDAVEA